MHIYIISALVHSNPEDLAAAILIIQELGGKPKGIFGPLKGHMFEMPRPLTETELKVIGCDPELIWWINYFQKYGTPTQIESLVNSWHQKAS